MNRPIDGLSSLTPEVRQAYDGDPAKTVRILPDLQEGVTRTVPSRRGSGEVLILQAPSTEAQDGHGFRLGEVIGEGAMGVIHSAEQLSLGREVAIKRLKPSKRHRARSARLEREAALLSQLEHPNIPPVHLLGVDETGLPAVVMKLISGVPWKEMARSPDHPAWDEVAGERIPWLLRVFIQVCHAVEYAHSRGVLHLDIKAENIMIGRFGEVYLIDWGISEWLDDDGKLSRQSFAGTPSHAAPEMFFAGADLTRATDMYLLGATLIEVLTGRVLRESADLDGMLELATQPVRQDFPDAVHPHLRDICLKAVALRPQERYGSAHELITALSGHLDLRAALEMVREGEHHLALLRAAVGEGASSDRDVRQLAFRCRLTFEQALRMDGTVDDARRGVLASLELLLTHRVSLGDVVSARRIYEELPRYGADAERLERAERVLIQAVSQRQRADEIATQIQHRLIEQMQATAEPVTGSD